MHDSVIPSCDARSCDDEIGEARRRAFIAVICQFLQLRPMQLACAAAVSTHPTRHQSQGSRSGRETRRLIAPAGLPERPPPVHHSRIAISFVNGFFAPGTADIRQDTNVMLRSWPAGMSLVTAPARFEKNLQCVIQVPAAPCPVRGMHAESSVANMRYAAMIGYCYAHQWPVRIVASLGRAALALASLQRGPSER